MMSHNFSAGSPHSTIGSESELSKTRRAALRGRMLFAWESGVVGYYALATGVVAHIDSPGRVRHNLPDPVPVMVIGRLAVDQTVQGHAIGPALLRDAVLRTVQAAEIAGIRAILVHAISERTKRFYEKCGFVSSPVQPMTLMITKAEARKAITDKSEELQNPLS